MTANVPLGKPLLVVLVGPPGSGKTTWARRHGQGAVHVSQDDLIDAIIATRLRLRLPSHLQCGGRRDCAHGAGRRAHRHRRSNQSNTRVTRALAAYRPRGGLPVVAVVMTADRSLCQERNRARTGPRHVSDDRMERMLAAMEPVAQDEGFAATFNGDAVTLAGILAHLKSDRKESHHEYCHEAR